MATIDLGKIKFTWRSAFSTSNTYEADDVVSYGGSSWIYINTTSKTGTDAGVPSTSNTTHWELMADGTNPLTTQGDMMTHDGTNSIRLARGNSGDVLTVDGNNLSYSPIDAFKGRNVLQPNYDHIARPNASQDYGASGKYNWLADYDNNWIPESGISNTACGPVMFAFGHDRRGYRTMCYLNENHEVVAIGADGYFWKGMNNSPIRDDHINVSIQPEFGGLKDGEYFVKIWDIYQNIYCLTNKGSLFAAGYNAYGQLGVGDTVDRYNLVKIPAFGEGTTHGGQSNRVIGFHVQNGGDGYGNNHHCFAINEQGDIFAWGENGNGQLGVGNTSNQTRPIQIVGISNARQVQNSYLTTMVVDSSGRLYGMGYNANGVLAGATLSANSTSPVHLGSVSDCWQVIQTTHTWYSGGWTYVGNAHYINTSGELYGTGYAGIGNLGDGTTTDKNAWTRIGGSQTFSSVYYAGNSYYNTIYALGGTANASDHDLFMWGYNGNGQLVNGANSTNGTSPSRPTTTTTVTNTTTSTATDSAPTTTALVFPRDDIYEVFPQGGLQGQPTSHISVIDNVGKHWWSGHTGYRSYFQNNRGNTSYYNFNCEIAPWTSPETTTAKTWRGGQTARATFVCEIPSGYSYNSEGRSTVVLSDGTIWMRGYNGNYTIDNNGDWGTSWVQIN